MAYNGYLADQKEIFNSYATSYTDFTSALITSTFEALLDNTLKQVEAYTDMVSVMSKDLTTYINETTNEVSDEEVLQYLESLPLKEAGLLDQEESLVLDYNDNGIPELKGLLDNDTPGSFNIVNLGKAMTNAIPGEGLIKNAYDVIAGAVGLPTASNDIATLDDLKQEAEGAADETNLNAYIFKAVAQRIASNKYGLLENMVRLGFMRLVVQKGVVETTLNMSFSEVSKYSKEEKEKIKDKKKKKTVDKSKPGFASFLFGRRNKSREKSKHIRIEVKKTKENQKEVNKGSVETTALVRIEFASDFQPLAS